MSLSCRAYRPTALFLTIPLLLAARIACADPAANALPTGFSTLDPVNTPVIDGNTMTIKQHADRVVIDWERFDIGKDAAVVFDQPLKGIAVNRISNNSGDPTQIHGALSANGTVILLDRNGILFGKNAKIDTAGLIASTGHITHLTENGFTLENVDANPLAYIENRGTITVADGGLAAFVAPSVRNSGIIRARLGTAVLASGNAVTLDMYGDGLWSVAVPEGLAQGIAEARNSGTIAADGGQVYLTVRAAQSAADAVINNTGLVSAQRFSQRDGKIVLHGAGPAQTLTNALQAGTDANLQQALDSAATDGSTTLHLQAGNYDTPLTVRQPVTVSGPGAGVRLSGQGDDPVLTVAADNVTLQYLHILGGVFAEGVQNLRVIGNMFTQSGIAALRLIGTAAAEITGNTFFYSGDGGPVRLEKTQATHLSDNIYFGSGDYGAESRDDSGLIFEDATFFGNYAKWLSRISGQKIDDNRLRLVLPAAAPRDNTADITIIDPAALAALAPAAGDCDPAAGKCP